MRRWPHLIEGFASETRPLRRGSEMRNRVAENSTPRHVCLDCCSVRFIHEYGFTEGAFTFAALILEQVTLALTATENFSGAGDFEPLTNGFPGFGNACVFGHRGGENKGNTSRCKGFIEGIADKVMNRGLDYSNWAFSSSCGDD